MHGGITKKHIILGVVGLFVLALIFTFALNQTQIPPREAMIIALEHLGMEDAQAFLAEMTLFEGRRTWRVEIGFNLVPFFEVYVEAVTGTPLRIFPLDPLFERDDAIALVEQEIVGSTVMSIRNLIEEDHRRVWHIEAGRGEEAFYIWIDATTGELIDVELPQPETPAEDAIITALARVGGGEVISYRLCWHEQHRVWRIIIEHEDEESIVYIDTSLNMFAGWGMAE